MAEAVAEPVAGSTPRVIVIGAGLIGRATAYFLAHDGAAVTLVDRDPAPSATSRASLGVLTHAYGRHDALSEFYRDSLALHEPLAARLQQQSDIDVGWRPLGGIDVAFNEDDAEALRQNFDFNRSRGADAIWLDAQQLRDAEPGLSHAALGGVLFPQDARVDPVRLGEALLSSAIATGCRLRLSTTVQAVQATDTGVRCELADADGTRTETFDAGVVTTGAWSKTLLPCLGVRPVRGQSARLAGEHVRHVVRWGGQHALPDGDGATFIGGTVEDVGFDLSTTEAAAAELGDWAAHMFTARAELSGLRAGLRPKPRQGRPFIAPVHDGARLFAAAGHYKNGVLMGPLTGKVVARWVLHHDPGRDMSPFALAR